MALHLAHRHIAQENRGAMASGGVTTALTLADGVLVDLSIVGTLGKDVSHSKWVRYCWLDLLVESSAGPVLGLDV